LDPKSKEIHGIQNVLKAYRNIAPELKMAGPTYFAPVFKQCISDILQDKASGVKNQYYILLILTDGEVHDMEETIG
jgi:hypothetical protein